MPHYQIDAVINDLGKKEFIIECESRYNKLIYDISQNLILSGIKIIMLSGPSASGKTVSAMKLKDILLNAGVYTEIIFLDDFYLSRDLIPRNGKGEPDLETVHALDLKYLHDCMSRLSKIGFTEFPRYDFISGKRTDSGRIIKNDGIVIIEGIHALNPLVTSTVSDDFLKIFINASSEFSSGNDTILSSRDVRFVRRLIRDHKFRGSSTEHTFKLWQGVIFTEGEYIMPYSDFADITLDTTFAYEPFLFAQTAVELLKHTSQESIYFNMAQRLIKSLDSFCVHGDRKKIDEHIPPDSILREFIGGSELFDKYL